MANPPTDITRKQKFFGLVGSVFWLVAGLSPQRIRGWLGDAIGLVLYATARSRRKIVARNLELCFPEQTAVARMKTTRKIFRNAGCGFLSWGFALFASEQRITQVVDWHGKETFEKFLKLKRPVILLCPHLVSPMLTLRMVGTVSPVVSMYRQPRNSIFDMGYHCALTGIKTNIKWLNRIYRQRGTHDIKMVPSQGSMRPFFRAMTNGVPFFYLPDLNANKPLHSTFAPFFGVQASTFTSLTRFAQFRNARIVLCYSIMSTKRKGYEMHTESLPHDFITGDQQVDAERLNEVVEKIVRRTPEQYFWLHRRFATRPEGEPPIY